MAKKAKRFINILLFNVVLIGVGIFILELIYGDWINHDNINKLNIIKDRTITYNVDDLYESSLKTATYTRDIFGLRGQFENPSEIVILTVGGSTTDQRYITDEQTWQYVLQCEFKKYGKEIPVANAGIDGQSTFGHIKNFDYWFPDIPGLKPKYILFYIGINDFYKDEGFGYDALVTNNVDRSLDQLIKERSAIYHIIRTLYGIYQAEEIHNIGHGHFDFKKVKWVSDPLQTSYDKYMDTRLKEYAERLEVLIQRTNSLGSNPIFVTQPSRKYRFNNSRIEGVEKYFYYDGIPINGVDYYYMMNKLDDVTCSVAKKHNIIYIELARELIQELEDDDFYDFAHMNPKGAKKVGQYLFKILRNQI